MESGSLSIQKMKNNSVKGLQSRLIKVFAIQATMVSVATILGVLAAYSIAENVLVKQALLGEAEYFWMLYREQGTVIPPNTHNMRAHLANLDSPNSIANLPEGLHPLQPNFFGRVQLDAGSSMVLVSQQKNKRLYLIFKEEQVSQLAIMFGVAPLSIVLILIYLVSWVTFRQSQKVISPVTDLVKVVEKSNIYDRFALEDQLSDLIGIDSDIDALATALTNYSKRLQHFIDRERSFTRNASHELRTPLAVIQGSVDILTAQSNLSDQQRTVVDRIAKTTKQMGALIETLLLLAKEDHQKLVEEKINLSQLTQRTIEQVKLAIPQATSDINVVAHEKITIIASKHILSIVLTNLIRNALQHGGNQPVTVELTTNSMSVTDQGEGMDKATLKRVFEPFQRNTSTVNGHGLGLAIVERLCEHSGWNISVDSQPGKGTRITIFFDTNRRRLK